MDISALIAAPVIGFDGRGLADKYWDSLEHDPPLVGNTDYGRFYLKNPAQSSLFTEVLASPRDFQNQRDHTLPVYRNAMGDTRNIEGAFNTLFLFGGKRSVAFPRHARTRHELLQAIGYMSRDCYAVWRDLNGNPFDHSPVSVKHTVTSGYGEDASKTIVRGEAMVARRARALLYTRRLHVQADPHIPDGDGIGWIHQTRVTMLTVEVLDRKPDVPDALRIQVASLSSNGYDGDYEPCELSESRDNNWHEMLEEARRGFDRECIDCTPEIKAKYEEVLANAHEARSRTAANRAYNNMGYNRLW